MVCSKLDYGCFVYGTASTTNLRQLVRLQHWIKTGTWSVLHQPSLQFVHRGHWGTPVKAVHALLSQNLCLHWQSSTSCPAWIWPNHSGSICSQAKWERRHDPISNMRCWSQGRGSWSLCREQYWFETQLPTRYTLIWPNETQPHWRSEQMYDFQIRSPGQIQRVSWHSRMARWSLYRWIQDRGEIRGSGGH